MVSFKWMQFSTIDFIQNDFQYHKNILKFHNHITNNKIPQINHYSKEFIRIIKRINLMKFKNIKKNISNIKNANILDSNGSIKITVQIMKRYGFSARYIIKEMLGGENIKNIEYFSIKRNVQEVKSASPIDHNSRILIKVPLRRGSINKVRLIILIINNKSSKVIYPLYLDTNHFASSASNFTLMPGNKIIFENEFRKKLYYLV